MDGESYGESGWMGKAVGGLVVSIRLQENLSNLSAVKSKFTHDI